MMGDPGEADACEAHEGLLERLFNSDSDVITRRIPSRNTDYSRPRYWRDRYEGEKTILYDWYNTDFETFWRSHMEPLCSVGDNAGREPENVSLRRSPLMQTLSTGAPPTSAAGPAFEAATAVTEAGLMALSMMAPLVVVEIGSGNSEWSMRMAQRGLSVVSTDVDAGVMASMSQLHASHPLFAAHPVERIAADARCLPFRGVVDMVVDKGTVDALLCQAPSEHFQVASATPAEIQLVVPVEVRLWTEAERMDGVASLARSVYRSLKLHGSWLLASAKSPALLLAAVGHLQLILESVALSPVAPGLHRTEAGEESPRIGQFNVHLLSDASDCGITVLRLVKQAS